jgi:hypothetical protein
MALLVPVEPLADRRTCGHQVDAFNVAVPHRQPPCACPDPALDPAAAFMADASSPSRSNVVTASQSGERGGVNRLAGTCEAISRARRLPP